jgi:hypothetical protein
MCWMPSWHLLLSHSFDASSPPLSLRKVLTLVPSCLSTSTSRQPSTYLNVAKPKIIDLQEVRDRRKLMYMTYCSERRIPRG